MEKFNQNKVEIVEKYSGAFEFPGTDQDFERDMKDLEPKVKLIGFNSGGEYLSSFGLYWYSFSSGDTYGLRFRRFSNGKTTVIVDESISFCDITYIINAMNEHNKQLVLNLLA